MVCTLSPTWFLSLLMGAHLSLCASSYSITTAPICEDSLDGGNTPPFKANDIPCLLGCGSQVAVATGSLLPGSVDESAIPYCELNCVLSSASPSQSADAPACYDICSNVNGGNVENKGWCMYWCVAGYSDVVASTACVPSLIYVPATTVIDGKTMTYEKFSQPSAWLSWFATETIMGKTITLTTLDLSTTTSAQSTPKSTSASSTVASSTVGNVITTAPTITSTTASSTASTTVSIASDNLASTTMSTGLQTASGVDTGVDSAAPGSHILSWTSIVFLSMGFLLLMF